MNRGTLKNKIVRRSARFCFPLLYEKIIRNSISATEYISRIELIWNISHAQKKYLHEQETERISRTEYVSRTLQK